MSKKKTHNEFLEELSVKNRHYREGKFKVIGKYLTVRSKILIKTEFGECYIYTKSLLNGNMPNIQSAVNKNLYFINEATKVHGGKYNYPNTIYVKSQEKVEIYCKKHGSFFQKPNAHLMGNGCHVCGTHGRLPKQHNLFLKELVTKNKYFKEGQFKVLGVYKGAMKKLLIEDNYGKLLVTPGGLLTNATPTVQSAVDKNSYIKNKFKEVHGDIYGYDKINYIDSNTPLTILCAKHGYYSLRPADHLRGRGCRKCRKEITKR